METHNLRLTCPPPLLPAGAEHNFDKYSSSYIGGFGEQYDYGSVMHYSAYAFSANGEKTIVTEVMNAGV